MARDEEVIWLSDKLREEILTVCLSDQSIKKR